MWKTLSKIRKNLEVCSRFQDVTKNQNPSTLNTVQCKISRYSLGLGSGSKFSDDGRKRHQQRSNHQNGYFQLNHDWLDAIGWSGVILLGWHIVQPYRNHIFSRHYARTNSPNQQSDVASCNHWKLVKHVTELVITSASQNVLPAVRAVKPTKNVSEVQFDEDLREGCSKLEKAHEIASSALVNFLGTECMQNGQHSEAFRHFTEAAKYENSAAMFNLGICYEMGLGTQQSFQKAGDLYKKASALGHATAMYNLGVFHVHGWGGVEIDVDAARDLFVAAAKLGQPDAQSALRATKTDADQSSDSPAGPKYEGIYREMPEYNDGTEYWFKALNINLNDTQVAYSKDEEFSSADSGVNITPIT